MLQNLGHKRREPIFQVWDGEKGGKQIFLVTCSFFEVLEKQRKEKYPRYSLLILSWFQSKSIYFKQNQFNMDVHIIMALFIEMRKVHFTPKSSKYYELPRQSSFRAY